ncbi:MAG: hypothetical protein PHQ52_06725 [Candidatus Omnitrophica bacterium]|jgi:hypothetical protein|nr:hypothetical protein [Candidatus Omnitrophota bacterium]
MKKYISPKVKAVVLDPDQAVLEVCKLGGHYFKRITATVCFYGTDTMGECYVTPKGGATFILGGATPFPSGMPS